MQRATLSGLVIVLYIFFTSGCATTTLTGSWHDPEYADQVKKIYIVGISKQETSRRAFEDEFGRALLPYGVKTISSYRDLKKNEERDLELLSRKVKDNGADALLLTRVLKRRTEEVVNPGRVTSYSTSPAYYGGVYRPQPYYRNYRDYYDRRYEMTYEPATISQFQVITIESNLYDAASGKLVWSAQLETVIEGSMQSIIRDFIEVVTRDLVEKGLI